jgi:hypothetical protein
LVLLGSQVRNRVFVRLCGLAPDITLTFAARVTQRQLFCPYIAISYGGFRKLGDVGQPEARRGTGTPRTCPSNPGVSGLHPAAVAGEHLSARAQEGEDSSCIQRPFGLFSREDCVGLGLAPALGHVLA